MKKRITESDLNRIVKRVIKEDKDTLNDLEDRYSELVYKLRSVMGELDVLSQEFESLGHDAYNAIDYDKESEDYSSELTDEEYDIEEIGQSCGMFMEMIDDFLNNIQ
jgi:hypothetical protein